MGIDLDRRALAHRAPRLDAHSLRATRYALRYFARSPVRSTMTTVVLERTVDNRFDQHAIAIKTLGGDQLGSIARTENRSTHPGRFYCPRLLASCTINHWVDDSVITHGGDCEDPNRYYGTVKCRASTKTMSVGSVAALPFDLPLDLIDRARTLTDRLDAAGHPQWVERKVKLLAASTKSASHLNDDDGDVPRCCISGLPTENLEPMWWVFISADVRSNAQTQFSISQFSLALRASLVRQDPLRQEENMHLGSLCCRPQGHARRVVRQPFRARGRGRRPPRPPQRQEAGRTDGTRVPFHLPPDARPVQGPRPARLDTRLPQTL